MTATAAGWAIAEGMRASGATAVSETDSTARRMTQIRELYGERLNDPQTVLELVVALGA